LRRLLDSGAAYFIELAIEADDSNKVCPELTDATKAKKFNAAPYRLFWCALVAPPCNFLSAEFVQPFT